MKHELTSPPQAPINDDGADTSSSSKIAIGGTVGAVDTPRDAIDTMSKQHSFSRPKHSENVVDSESVLKRPQLRRSDGGTPRISKTESGNALGIEDTKQLPFSLTNAQNDDADDNELSTLESEHIVGSFDFDKAPSSSATRDDDCDDDSCDSLSIGFLTEKNDNPRQLQRFNSVGYGGFAGSSRRCAITNNSISDGIAREMSNLEVSTRGQDWIRSFRDLDPRFQILNFFNDLSLDGVEHFESQGCRTKGAENVPKLLRVFIKSGIFSVWRPTSPDAIAKMITGEGTGKGLDIKGKSAKCGQFSGFVPYLQIHDNEHKQKIGDMTEDGRVRVFYPNQSSRDTAAERLADHSKEMANIATQIIRDEDDKGEPIVDSIIEEENDHEENEQILDINVQNCFVKISRSRLVTRSMDEAPMEISRCLMDDPSVYKIDDYAFTEGIYGLDIPEKLFWESYIVPNDITRPKGSKFDTGRSSMPEFQQMNNETLRNWYDPSNDYSDDSEGGSVDEGGSECADADADPRPVLWHGGCGKIGEEPPEDSNPMCPLGLLMAYEENDKVTPVVSDFDCFLVGTRRVEYNKPFGTQELATLSCCVEEIKGILSTPREGSDWTTRWLEVKKKHADKGDTIHQMPKFGYADPRSYGMMTGAVRRMKSNGAVRHGPECFNYGFPQELDDKYLVISDTFPGVPWRYTNGEELVDILSEKVDEGFTFPLNPKWILCDPGWKKVYDKLLASSKPNVQNSLDIWYPDEIRKRISDISTRFPQGFITSDKDQRCSDLSSGVRFDLAILELKRHKIRLSSRRKLRIALSRRSLGSETILYRQCSALRLGDVQSSCNNAFLKTLQVVHTAHKTKDLAVQEDHAVNKTDDLTGGNDEYRPDKQRRSSSITFDIMRESTGTVDSALTESLLSLGHRESVMRDYGYSESWLSLDLSKSDSDGDNSEDGDISEATPLEIDSLANISDDESDCSERGSDDANISEDSLLPGRRKSSASSKIKALKNRLSRGSSRKKKHSKGESEGGEGDAENANDPEATQSQRGRSMGSLSQSFTLPSAFKFSKKKA
mmetsp:Transcript_41451/g.86956  ORF Transcript_41451/g.86956 Transcript_41451/m.86956 type:complete len:1059 (-) Transcript_41451:124-3300(-)